MMNKYEKILIVFLAGSVWGALELFGGDLFRTLGIPIRSAWLFGLGLIIIYASKRIGGFAGSVIIMAAIAGIFKTASSSFYPCQFTALMINGLIFEATYQIFKTQLDSSPIYRAIAAPVIAYVSFAVFAIGATYFLREPNWAARGLTGIGDYLSSDAIVAALFSIVTINLGYYLGNALRPLVAERKIGMPLAYFRIALFMFVGAIWIAGQLY